MKTYRYSGHSRSDPAAYRLPGELDAWLKRDPIKLFADRLESEKVIAAGGFEPLFEDVRASVEDATSEVLASPAPALDQILSHVTAASAGGDQRWNFWSK